MACVFSAGIQPAEAVQGIPYRINFQGRLADSSGNVLPDGYYNIKFRIWDALTSGTNLWQEDRIMTGSDNRVQVTNGLFSVQLGSLTALNPSVFNSSSQRYLEIELPSTATATCATNGCASFTEGAFTPRQPLAASPYAYNSDTLDGIDSAGFAQLSPGSQQTGFINISGNLTSGGSLQGTSATLTGTGGLTLGAATSATGKIVFQNSTNSNTVTLQSGAVTPSSFSLTLPTALGASGDCLKDTNGSGLLGFGSCAASGSLQSAYNASSSPALITTTSATKDIVVKSGVGFNSASAFQVIPDGTSTPTFNVDTTNNRIGVAKATPSYTLDVAGDINTTGVYRVSGTQISSANLSNDSSITKQGNTFNGVSQLVQLNGSGAFPSLSALNLTNLNPTNFATGTGAVTLASGASGNLTLDSASATVLFGATTTTLQKAASTFAIDLATNATSTLTIKNSNGSNVANLSVTGGVTIGSGKVFTVGASAGVAVTCSGGQFIQNQTTVGGITTGGTCATAATDLQSVYTAATSPATMDLNTSAKDFVINATDQTVDPNILLNLQCTTCSAGAGRFAVQDGSTDVLTVNPVGSVVVAPSSGQNLTVNLPASSGMRIASATSPTVDQLNIDNTAGTGVTTAGVNGLSLNYKGGAAAVEASGIRVDFAPGTTSGGTWSGLRIAANATGPVTGVTEYGIKLEGPTSPGAGQETAAYVGTGWDIGVDVQSGGIQLAAQSDPAAPAAGNLRIYAKDIAGRVMPKWIGPAGVDTSFQANLGFNRVSMIMPAGGTTLTTFVGGFGSTFTNTGTAANPALASTNQLTSVRRATFSTGTTAGTVASHRQSVLQVWRGNAAGLGGFFYTIRFGTSAVQTGNRAFVGMADSIAAPTNVDPTTNTTPGKIGVAINASTGNWNLVNNVSGTAPTVTPLGANFPVSTSTLYELVLYSPPNGSFIGYRVTNISTGNSTSGSLTTNIPASTTFMSPQFWITNNATAAASVLDFSGWYLESDN